LDRATFPGEVDGVELGPLVEKVALYEGHHVGLAARTPPQIDEQRIGVRDQRHGRLGRMPGDPRGPELPDLDQADIAG